MKSARIALALLVAGTTTAFAQTALDADGDGMVTLAELQAVYPDFSAEDFALADTDDDQMLSEDEMAVAIESGIIPAQE